MRSTFACLLAALIGTLAGRPVQVGAQEATRSWLDPKPPGWNVPGASVPSAPSVDGGVDARCRATARQPVLAEDRLVRERGWDLVGSYEGGWPIVVIRGTAGYDGMCRPMQYQDFVFVRGVFAGTLSPRPMDSRTDGAISQVQGSTRVRADYTRYTAADALCCPSRMTTVVFEVVGEPPIVQPESLSTMETVASVSDAAPPAPPPAAAASLDPALAGTSWRLVKLEGRDGAVLRPDDPSKYTLEFAADGRLSVRVDCNLGRGRWTADGKQIVFTNVSVTRTRCTPSPLQARMAAESGDVRDYVIRDGRLFLSVMTDNVYEFEPYRP